MLWGMKGMLHKEGIRDRDEEESEDTGEIH